MPFALDSSPELSELSDAVNYLLANFSPNVSADINTGQIIGPAGQVTGYLYKYIAVKYADSFDGTVNFSDSPTNREYYGIRNSNSTVESANPSDYLWYKVSGGFGTTKFLFYMTFGGRGIEFYVGTTAPSQFYVEEDGSIIDLDLITSAPFSPANFAVIRSANDFSPPTNAEVLSAIGRLPIDGDLCIVNYNAGIASIQYKYLTSWVVFQKILTGDLIVANSIVGTNIAASTITGTNIAGSTITGTNIAANTIDAGKLNVLQLSAIAADLGTITAGSISSISLNSSTLTVGTSPVVVGTTMTGNGAVINAVGSFAFGNASTNISFNGSQLTLNGNVVNTANINSNAVTTSAKATSVTFAMEVGDAAIVMGGTAARNYVGSGTNLTRTTNLNASTGTFASIANQVVYNQQTVTNYYPACLITGLYICTSAGNITFTVTNTGGNDNTGTTGISASLIKR